MLSDSLSWIPLTYMDAMDHTKFTENTTVTGKSGAQPETKRITLYNAAPQQTSSSK